MYYYRMNAIQGDNTFDISQTGKRPIHRNENIRRPRSDGNKPFTDKDKREIINDFFNDRENGNSMYNTVEIYKRPIKEYKESCFTTLYWYIRDTYIRKKIR